MSYLILEGAKLSKRATQIIKALRERGIAYDNIICTGNSGVLMASVLAAREKKFITIYRKEENPAHGTMYEYSNTMINYNMVNTTKGEYTTIKSIVLDDLVDSGDTLRTIFDKTSKHGILSRCIDIQAVVVYNQKGNIETVVNVTEELAPGVSTIVLEA